MKYGNRKLNISDLVMNEGQIEGLPRNPRQWTKADLQRLRKSIVETPELLDARPVLCVPHDGKYIALGGNMRLSACKAEKMKEVPCYVYREDTPIEKLKEIVIKDNASFGDWDTDALANEWSDVPLDEWGATDWKDESESGMVSSDDKEAEEDNFDPAGETIVCRCKRGDVWMCGEHRVMCGDSSNSEDVEILMGGG